MNVAFESSSDNQYKLKSGAECGNNKRLFSTTTKDFPQAFLRIIITNY